MKVSRILGVLSLAATVAFIAGCSKQDQTTTSSAPDASTAPAPTASTAPAPAADTAVQAAPAIAPAPATDASAAAAAATTTATDQTQGLIDKAKSLVDNSQYADASKILQQLSTMQLTPDQQKIVDDLKTLVQKKLADQGTGALGGLLNK